MIENSVSFHSCFMCKAMILVLYLIFTHPNLVESFSQEGLIECTDSTSIFTQEDSNNLMNSRLCVEICRLKNYLLSVVDDKKCFCSNADSGVNPATTPTCDLVTEKVTQ